MDKITMRLDVDSVELPLDGTQVQIGNVKAWAKRTETGLAFGLVMGGGGGSGGGADTAEARAWLAAHPEFEEGAAA